MSGDRTDEIRGVGFVIEKRADVAVLVWPGDGGCRPATDPEIGLWAEVESLRARVKAAEAERDWYKGQAETFADRGNRAMAERDAALAIYDARNSDGTDRYHPQHPSETNQRNMPESSYESMRTDIIGALHEDGYAYLEAAEIVRRFEMVVRATDPERAINIHVRSRTKSEREAFDDGLATALGEVSSLNVSKE